jgi:hypothetical protein
MMEAHGNKYSRVKHGQVMLRFAPEKAELDQPHMMIKLTNYINLPN